MPSSAWAFSLRHPANDYDSESDSDQPPPPTVEERVQRVTFKSTPRAIAKVNAAARSDSSPEKPPHALLFPKPDLQAKQQSSLTRHRGSDFIRLNPQPPQFRPRPLQTFAIPSTPSRGSFSRSSLSPGLRASSPAFRPPAAPAPPSASPTKPSAHCNPAFYGTDAEWSTLPASKKLRVGKPAIRSTGKFDNPLAAAAPPPAAVLAPGAGPSYLPPPSVRMRVREAEPEPKWTMDFVPENDDSEFPDLTGDWMASMESLDEAELAKLDSSPARQPTAATSPPYVDEFDDVDDPFSGLTAEQLDALDVDEFDDVDDPFSGLTAEQLDALDPA